MSSISSISSMLSMISQDTFGYIYKVIIYKVIIILLNIYNGTKKSLSLLGRRGIYLNYYIAKPDIFAFNKWRWL
jgi:hypothetical protein